VGAGLVILVSDRLGYFKSLLAGIVLTVLATAGYIYSGNQAIWIIINGIIGITWAYTIAYMLGLASRFDASGQMAALGGFGSKLGLASGPALAAFLLGDNNYPLIIGVAVAGLVLSLLAVVVPARTQDKTSL
jgi:MFS family permease